MYVWHFFRQICGDFDIGTGVFFIDWHICGKKKTAQWPFFCDVCSNDYGSIRCYYRDYYMDLQRRIKESVPFAE